MGSINTITVSGNLGKDPEIKEFNSGTKKVTFSVAVSEPVKVDSKWENKTTWLLVEFWGKDADYIGNYAHKGSFIVVNGRMAEDTWEKDGVTQRKMYIKGNSFHLPKVTNEGGGTKSESNQSSGNGNFNESIPF